MTVGNVRLFGTCYVCGRPVWGIVLRIGRPYATSTKARYAVGDDKGVRHSTCYPSESGSGSRHAQDEKGVTR